MKNLKVYRGYVTDLRRLYYSTKQKPRYQATIRTIDGERVAARTMPRADVSVIEAAHKEGKQVVADVGEHYGHNQIRDIELAREVDFDEADEAGKSIVQKVMQKAAALNQFRRRLIGV